MPDPTQPAAPTMNQIVNYVLPPKSINGERCRPAIVVGLNEHPMEPDLRVFKLSDGEEVGQNEPTNSQGTQVATSVPYADPLPDGTFVGNSWHWPPQV